MLKVSSLSGAAGAIPTGLLPFRAGPAAAVAAAGTAAACRTVGPRGSPRVPLPGWDSRAAPAAAVTGAAAEVAAEGVGAAWAAAMPGTAGSLAVCSSSKGDTAPATCNSPA